MDSALTLFLADIGKVTTHLMGNFTNVLKLMTEQPILLFGVGIFATGAVIGLVARLKNS